MNLSLNSLDRRPMLTAILVYAIGFGIAALIVLLALSREASCAPNPQIPQQRYIVWVAQSAAIETINSA